MINKLRDTKWHGEAVGGGLGYCGQHKSKLSLKSTKGMGGNGNDRFIPKNTSKKSYYSSSQLKSFLESLDQFVDPQLQSRSPSPEFFTGQDLPIDTLLTPEMSSILESGGKKGKKKMPKHTKQHRKYMADALGFPDSNRVLHFSQAQSGGGQYSNGEIDTYSIQTPTSSIKHAREQHYQQQQQQNQQRNSKRAESRVPYRVLEAPHLRKDFYSNLVDWSPVSNNVAVALDTAVFLWSDKVGAFHVLRRDYLEKTSDTVQCISFSPNDLMLVGTKRGKILLFSQEAVESSVGNGPPKALAEITVKCQSGICCCQWYQDGNQFIVGTEVGVVYKFNVKTELIVMSRSYRRSDALQAKINGTSPDISSKKIIRTVRISESWSLHVHSQQVCGAKICEDTKQIAIGGNDNCCTIWKYNEDDLDEEPEFQFKLKHASAVKAMAFCPWSKSLLVTGGGSYDRHLRFWHSKSGTLLREFKTPGQITSIIWSKRQKQLLVTFGFTNQEVPVFIIMYKYPSMEEIIRIKQPTQLRALTAATSPDARKICVASDDETVRFYSIWENSCEDMIETPADGIYGSEIIEHEEGVSLEYLLR
ncbi:meiosis-specific APC/C activator protein AMA1 [Kluyveromyces marxianus]|uniref:Meiosis-specific APC/C activator protein AMA1 n=2 Tax=Kluyveromyces marxianus TaxID=4911 RepID=W0TGX1_KLUMD|nr:meiosis-specific APC/C activator protein AMA1 [Kluyveromyces marxianus DMKU3-1042]BAO41349.1 meiosis-specific APC/C activator protein AMA1 [Kluyveromyces marxianus DMKU3-1042]BAP72800.1 meiosis-specific APC/C activator protein AMA1 [Kluyveromyces marxianus]